MSLYNMNKHVTCILLLLAPLYMCKTLRPLIVSTNMCHQKYTPSVDIVDIAQRIAQKVKTCSHDRTSIEPVLFPYIVSLPHCDDDWTCDYKTWTKDIDTIVDSFTQQEKYRIYILPNIPSCAWGGLAPIGCLNNGSTCTILIQGVAAESPMSYLHEIGHTLGLSHSYSQNRTTHQLIEYGDDTSAMGLCCEDRCFHAPHNAQLGWMFADQILRITSRTTSMIKTHTWIHIWKYKDNMFHIYTSSAGNPLGSIVVLEDTLHAYKTTWVHPLLHVRVQKNDVGLLHIQGVVS